ncbi:MAG: chorismate--pyruvate lyase [Lachnospiraceae bacterium]|nr:chorismate--pyruvate lyase [Lachnospiraceae bacterium]
MDCIIYDVVRIDGDYAFLVDEAGVNEEKCVARALLPEDIKEGSKVKYEMFSYELLN